MVMRSKLCGDILIILFWVKVTGIKNYKYTHLLKYLHVVQISLVSEINIYNQIFGTITSLSQTLQKLKKKFLMDAHYEIQYFLTSHVFSELFSGCLSSYFNIQSALAVHFNYGI